MALCTWGMSGNWQVVKRASILSLLSVVLSVIVTGCTREKAEESPKTSESTPPPAKATYEGGDVTNGGRLTGLVQFTGTRPRLQRRPVTKSPEICGHGTKPSEELILGEGGSLRNVVVTIEGIQRGKMLDASDPPAVLDQKKCDYIPHVQSITTGSTLEIRNSDDLLHNVHGKLDGRATVFNLAMPLKDQTISKQLTRPGMIKLQCDAGHTWMNGYVVVVEHPYHVTTDDRGRFVLGDVPPGNYKVKAWHERFGTLEQDVAVSAGSETKISFEYKTP